MPTTFTKTVGTTGRDYSTLTLAEADIATFATSADLVANDENVVFNIFADSVFDEHLVVDGQTTDATRNITFQADSTNRHDCTYDSGVVLAPSTNGHCIQVNDDYTVIDGLQIECANGSSDEAIRVNTPGHGVVIKNCILEGGTHTDNDGVYTGNWDIGQTAPMVVTNCLFYGFLRAGLHTQIFNQVKTQDVDVINCTFIDCDIAYGYRIDNSGAVLNTRIVNCYAAGSVTDNFADSGVAIAGTLTTTGSENNWAHTSAGDFPDETEMALTDSLSPSAPPPANFIVTDYTGTTLATTEFLLVDDADNDAMGAGTGNGSNALVPLVDAAGNTRPSGSTCDVGWHEITAPVGGPTTFIRGVVSRGVVVAPR